MVRLSVIIPTYNRADRLRVCLEALARQTQPADDFEVIVVVDGSTDDTHAMLESLSVPYLLRMLYQQNQGQQIARNAGVRIAAGEYCLFIDDDIIAAPELIAEHLQAHQKQTHVAVIGQMALHLPENASWFLRAYAQAWRTHYAELNAGQRQPTWQDCFGGNISISREDFLAVDGFAPDIRRSHDIEFGYRLYKHGIRFIYAGAALGAQDEQKSAEELAQDARKAGAAYLVLCERHPEIAPHLLGGLLEISLRERLVRSLLWNLRVSPGLLAQAGVLLARVTNPQRVYRFIHKYFYWRGVRQAVSSRAQWAYLTHGIPILMYHAFGAPEEVPASFVLPARRFARQLRLMRWLGYRTLSLEEFLQYRSAGQTLPRRAVILTMDDGYADHFTWAYPLLHKFKVPATVFLVSDGIGGQNHWADEGSLAGRALLTWETIQEMQHESQTTYGVHTRSHCRLPAVTAAQQAEEICGAKADLEAGLQVPVTLFAYPYGAYDEVVVSQVEQAGFKAACTVDPGLNSNLTPPFLLRRAEIYGTDSWLRFLLALWFGDPEALTRRRKSHQQV